MSGVSQSLADTEVPQLDGLVVGAAHYDVVVEGKAGDPVRMVPQGHQSTARVSIPHLENDRCVEFMCVGG